MTQENKQINVAIIGVGNCASSLVQGLTYYGNKNESESAGLMHSTLCGYHSRDVKVVAAFDIDQRKVGKDVAEAIFEKPNCTVVFQADVPKTGVKVQIGCIMDGYSDHMASYSDDRRFIPLYTREPTKAEVVKAFKEAKVDVVTNYLPVGSQEATEFYAECAIEAGCSFVNNIPVFIASTPAWAKKFEDAGLPIIGDDIKAQMGATIVHRVLTDLFHKRGVPVDRTYQLNTGGNTDFLNMKNQLRLESKKESKTEAVQAVAAERIEDENIHVGPSDYVPWQNDNKICFIRMEGRLFGDVPMNLELRLSVEDSPNSAGVAIDMLRCAKVAMDRGISGAIAAPSSFFCKHPPVQYTDEVAYQLTESFIAGESVEVLKHVTGS